MNECGQWMWNAADNEEQRKPDAYAIDERPRDHPELAEGTEAKSHQACGFIHQFAMEARGGTHWTIQRVCHQLISSGNLYRPSSLGYSTEKVKGKKGMEGKYKQPKRTIFKKWARWQQLGMHSWLIKLDRNAWKLSKPGQWKKEGDYYVSQDSGCFGVEDRTVMKVGHVERLLGGWQTFMSWPSR